ncbi:ribbon-helix-helix protein, CopG family [Actinoallomurus sp. CA-150999]|uniref:ribbon-helix-helix protein, CopG family n=1 Tax=Actinoallomurus sp. CA-150999 TaxID=3239887 RepID=UPI003D8A1D56
MTTRAFTVRVSEEQAEELEAIAAAEGTSVAEEVRSALSERIEARRKDKEFQARLRATMERNRRVLDRLAE